MKLLTKDVKQPILKHRKFVYRELKMTQSTENIYKDTKYRNQRRKRNKKRRRNRRLIMNLLKLLGVLLLLIGIITSVRLLSKKSAENVLVGDMFASDAIEKPEIPMPEYEISITVSVVGDCTLGTDEAFNHSTSLNAYYSANGPEYFLRNVKHIFESDDLTIANLEGTFTDSTTRVDKTFAFKGPKEFVKILTSSSVEAVTVANNHSSDYGAQSFSDTKQTLDDAGVVHFGYDTTAVVEVKGVKVGLVGIYELNDHTGRAQQVKDNIAKVKKDGADVVIVIFHWGIERDAAPNSHQTTLGRLAIDAGADLVCGHHPHVLQGIETYKGKSIVYSLGNFCFGGNSNPGDKDTMIFQQTFTITKNGVKVDNKTNIIPCSLSSVSYTNDYRPTPAQGDEATRILNKIRERSNLIPTP